MWYDVMQTWYDVIMMECQSDTTSCGWEVFGVGMIRDIGVECRYVGVIWVWCVWCNMIGCGASYVNVKWCSKFGAHLLFWNLPSPWILWPHIYPCWLLDSKIALFWKILCINTSIASGQRIGEPPSAIFCLFVFFLVVVVVVVVVGNQEVYLLQYS